MIKRTKRLWYIVVTLLVLAIVFLRWYSFFVYGVQLSEQRIQKTFWSFFDRVDVAYVTYMGLYGDTQIHYADIWPIDAPVLMLIHGAPWNMLDRQRVIADPRIAWSYRVVILDRLWYGRSDVGTSYTSISDHANAYMQLLTSLDLDPQTPIYLAGHSYGGPIVARMLADYSRMRVWDRLFSLAWGVIASWAVDPEHEVVFPISYIVDLPIIRRLIWPLLRVTNDEKLSHADSLSRDLSPEIVSQISVPTIVVHSRDDTLVPFPNALYLTDQIKHPYVYLRAYDDIGHPIQYTHPWVIVDAIEELRQVYEVPAWSDEK